MVAGAFYAFVIQRFKGGEVEDCSDNWSQQPRAGSALCTQEWKWRYQCSIQDNSS